jgi:hypothetical protein
MQIDWNEFSRGIEAELEKSAAPSFRPLLNTGRNLWNSGKSAVGQIPGAARSAFNTAKSLMLPAAGVGLGAYGANWGYNKFQGLQGAFGQGWDALSKLAPVGIMAALASGMRGNSAGGNAQMMMAGGGRPQSLLNVNPGGVTSLRSPKAGPAFSIAPESPMQVKLAFFDPIMWSARNRVANHILNEVTKTNPLSMDLPNKTNLNEEETAKNLELVTKYPELENLLKDEQNKAYLKKLLST